MKYQVLIGLDIYIPVRAMFPVYGSQISNQSSTYQGNYSPIVTYIKGPNIWPTHTTRYINNCDVLLFMVDNAI